MNATIRGDFGSSAFESFSSVIAPLEATLLDTALATPTTYADIARLHDLLTKLRREDPVHWATPEGFRPYWIVTRHADILDIERQSDIFHNEPRAVLLDKEVEQQLASLWGGPCPVTGRVSPLRTLIDMDGADHRAYRGLTQGWFSPNNLRKLDARLGELARATVDRMMHQGPHCDVMQDIAVRYPLHVIMSILGVPESDEPRMLRLTQELFGNNDPDYQRPDASLASNVFLDFFAYFQALTAERRANPGEDLASVIANGLINGQPLGDLETMSYYILVATAGHDTTSSTIAGGLLALAENPDQLALLQREPQRLNAAIDEMLRWVSPVQHFMRTAMQDVELRGKQIRKGDALQLLYVSANRDEDVFADPFRFDITRENNKHLAFGHGAHLCVGQHLARMEIRAFFAELLRRLDHLELGGRTRRVESYFVGGLKSLPLTYAIRPSA